MQHEEKHPSLTPLRALTLLRKLAETPDDSIQWLRNDVKDALTHHVAAAVVRGKRRKAEAPKQKPKGKGRKGKRRG